MIAETTKSFNFLSIFFFVYEGSYFQMVAHCARGCKCMAPETVIYAPRPFMRGYPKSKSVPPPLFEKVKEATFSENITGANVKAFLTTVYVRFSKFSRTTLASSNTMFCAPPIYGRDAARNRKGCPLPRRPTSWQEACPRHFVEELFFFLFFEISRSMCVSDNIQSYTPQNR